MSRRRANSKEATMKNNSLKERLKIIREKIKQKKTVKEKVSYFCCNSCACDVDLEVSPSISLV